MSRRTFRTNGLTAAGLAGALFVARSSSAACDDKAKFLSEEYLLNKGDCAVNKALDAGEGLLVDAGKSAAKALLNYYLPGVGSFLFGGGGDPFAADAAMIVNQIQETKVEIMRAIVDQTLIANAVTWDSITNRANDWANPFYDAQTKIDNLASLDSIITDLTTLRNAFETTNYGVWNLNAYAVAVQMELSLKADRETLRMLDQGQRNGDTQDQILANTQGAINYAWTNMLDGSGQIFQFLNGITMANFTTASDSRFVDLYSQLPIVKNLCGYEVGYRKYNVKTSAHPLMTPPKVAYEVGLNANTCTSRPPPGNFIFDVGTYSYLWTGTALASKPHLAATNSAGSVWQYYSGVGEWDLDPKTGYHPNSSAGPTLEAGFTKHKADEAVAYFVAGYGSLRPLMDRWKAAIGEGQNQQPNGLDTRIANYLSANVQDFVTFQAGYFAYMMGTSQPTAEQTRWSENYVLTNGMPEFEALLGTGGIDQLGISHDKYEGYLKNYTSSADAAADQQANFASKFVPLYII